jgi:hypothetical protein
VDLKPLTFAMQLSKLMKKNLKESKRIQLKEQNGQLKLLNKLLRMLPSKPKLKNYADRKKKDLFAKRMNASVLIKSERKRKKRDKWNWQGKNKKKKSVV